MNSYHEKSTDELLQLLIAEEDRVTLEHIQELAARADAIEPLRAWLNDYDRWAEAEFGEWWALYHAFTILALTQRAELLDDLLEAYKYAFLEDFDWIEEIGAAAFANFGPVAVDPLIAFINQMRRATQNTSAPFLRARVVTALTRIALEHPAERPRIAEFVISRLSDLEETDNAFLSLISGDALVLDYDRALAPLRSAFDRKVVDEMMSGNYEATLKWFATSDKEQDWEYTRGLLDFYQPENIAARQRRWKKEAEEEADQERIQRAKAALTRLGWTEEDEPAPPAGYLQTDLGTVVREDPKVGRNDPCPCGSGKKYKKCHGA